MFTQSKHLQSNEYMSIDGCQGKHGQLNNFVDANSGGTIKLVKHVTHKLSTTL